MEEGEKRKSPGGKSVTKSELVLVEGRGPSFMVHPLLSPARHSKRRKSKKKTASEHGRIGGEEEIRARPAAAGRISSGSRGGSNHSYLIPECAEPPNIIRARRGPPHALNVAGLAMNREEGDFHSIEFGRHRTHREALGRGSGRTES